MVIKGVSLRRLILWYIVQGDTHLSGILKGGKGGGDLSPEERHSRVTRDDGTVTLCALRAATVPLATKTLPN